MRDLVAYLKYFPPDSALAHVVKNPPRDPATVMTSDVMTKVSDRIAQARADARARGLKSVSTAHTTKKKKKRPPTDPETPAA